MPGGKKTTLTRDDFECWLIEMDSAISRFSSLFPSAQRSQLDFSRQSLDFVERWLLNKYPSHLELLKTSESEVLDGTSQYIGEVFRKYIGGHWDIELDNPKDAFYAIPKLTGFGSKSSPISPVTMATALLSRRTGNYLLGILENLEKRYGTRSV